MRVHRIRLQHVRGIDAVDVRLADRGVSIVEAPNESGKTTLLDALDIVLEHKDSTRRQEVRDLCPAGRDVGSLIEAELTCGDVHLTIRKRFNRDRMTELEVHAPQRAQYAGDDAHAQLRRILERTTDLALYDALRFRQDASVESPVLATSHQLAARLDEIAGGSGDTGDDALLARVRREFERYFTPSGQDGHRLRAADDAVAAAEADVADLSARRDAIDRDAERLEELERERVRLAAALAELEPALVEHRRRRDRVRSLREELRTCEARADVADGQRERAARDLAERRELVARVEQLATQVASHRPALGQVTERLAAHEQRLAEADAAVAAAAEREHAARVELDAARAAAELGRRREELRQLVARQQRIDDALTAASDAEAQLEACHLDDERLLAIHAARDEFRLAVARLDDAAPTVTVRSHADLALHLDDTAYELTAGERLERSVPDRLVLSLPGMAEVAITAGNSLADRQADVDRARERLDAACSTAGVGSPDEADRLAQQRREHERTLADRDAIIARELAGCSRQELADRIRTRTAQLRELEERLAPQDADGPTDAQLAFPVGDDVTTEQLAEVEARDVAARDAASHARAEHAALAQELERLRGEHRLAADQLQAREDELAAARERLAAARERAPDARLDVDLRDADSAVTHARQAVADARRELERLKADEVELLAGNAEQRTSRLRAEHGTVRDELTELRARIEVRGGEGIGEALDAATAALERARDDAIRLRRRAAAAGALKDAFEQARDAAYAAYREPLRDRIVRAGRVVFGDSLDVVLDDELRVVARHLDGVTLAWEHLSAGAREQLSVLTALAAADLAGGDGGQGVPFVLDDALGFTDPVRLERLCAVLGRVSGPQVIVLTCVAERFEAIGGATIVRLRDLLQPASRGSAVA